MNLQNSSGKFFERGSWVLSDIFQGLVSPPLWLRRLWCREQYVEVIWEKLLENTTSDGCSAKVDGSDCDWINGWGELYVVKNGIRDACSTADCCPLLSIVIHCCPLSCCSNFEFVVTMPLAFRNAFAHGCGWTGWTGWVWKSLYKHLFLQHRSAVLMMRIDWW